MVTRFVPNYFGLGSSPFPSHPPLFPYSVFATRPAERHIFLTAEIFLTFGDGEEVGKQEQK